MAGLTQYGALLESRHHFPDENEALAVPALGVEGTVGPVPQPAFDTPFLKIEKCIFALSNTNWKWMSSNLTTSSMTRSGFDHRGTDATSTPSNSYLSPPSPTSRRFPSSHSSFLVVRVPHNRFVSLKRSSSSSIHSTMKLLLTTVATALTLFNANAADLSDCVAVNFTERSTDFASLNAVLDLAVSSNLLSSFIEDPLIIEEANVAAESFSLLGMDFNFTADIKQLNITGITTVVPRHINVTSHNSLQLGADFSGNLQVSATIELEVEQLNHQWYQICWTDILHPVTCPPAVIDVDVTLGLDLLTLGLNGTFDMLGCAAGVATSECTNVTVSNILTYALTNKLDLLVSRVLTRFVDASIQDLAVGFDSITALDFAFKGQSVLITQLTSALLDFTANEINKKGTTYKIVIEVVNKLAVAILNKVIEDQLEPKFEATCLGTR